MRCNHFWGCTNKPDKLFLLRITKLHWGPKIKLISTFPWTHTMHFIFTQRHHAAPNNQQSRKCELAAAEDELTAKTEQFYSKKLETHSSFKKVHVKLLNLTKNNHHKRWSQTPVRNPVIYTSSAVITAFFMQSRRNMQVIWHQQKDQWKL